MINRHGVQLLIAQCLVQQDCDICQRESHAFESQQQVEPPAFFRGAEAVTIVAINPGRFKQSQAFIMAQGLTVTRESLAKSPILINIMQIL